MKGPDMRLHHTATIALAGCGLLLTLAACGNSTSSTSDVTFADLVALSYSSSDIQENGSQRPLATETPITLTFTEDGISVNAGCNTLFGGATIDDGRLTASSALASSMMMCEEPLMLQDEWLSAFMNASPQITTSEDTLTLTTDNSSIEFTVVENIGTFDTPIYGPEEMPKVQALCDTLVADGATTDQARAAAEDRGYVFRIIKEDGESFAATMDSNPGRLNVEVKGGIITVCNPG
jgi:heat shock protein HslJ